MKKILGRSAVAQATAVRQKSISAEELVSAHLEQVEAVNPQLNAVVQLGAESALADARSADAALARGENPGLLHGVPFTLKDSIDTAGVITTAGTLGRASFAPDEDATVTARLRSAGAILLGKTNTPELTMGAETVNLVYGRTNNPYDSELIPGGSSGGAAAIVAACGSAFDLGSDTGGSIRQPAHYCGVVGMRPTTGRVPLSGHIVSYDGGHLNPLTQIGPLCRSVEDAALILGIIAGLDGRDPNVVNVPLGDYRRVEVSRLRGAICTDNDLVTPSSEVAQVLAEGARVLGEAGVKLTEAWPSEAVVSTEMWRNLLTADGAAWIRLLLEEAGTTEPSPIVADRFFDAEPLSAPEFAALLRDWDHLRSLMTTFIADYDFILSPTNAFAAAPHGEVFAKGDGYTYTRIFNLTGWPTVIVRCGSTPEGLPIGLQIASRSFREDVALAVAGHLEEELGGWQPPSLAQ